MRRSLVAVLAASMVLATTGVGAADGSSPTGVASPVEHACGPHGETRCGSVPVPLDRSGHVPGTLHIGYERYPHTDTSQPGLETIVAIEGGPGYATTGSRGYYLKLFRPIMDRHDLLLVDLRGTGTSDPLLCDPLQHLTPPQYYRWVAAVGKCGRQLGAASNLYGTASATDDLASVMDALGLDTIDLYGDSYGSFFSDVFAIRHPDRLRALVLDATYPVQGADPWWRDLSRAAASGYRLACSRDPGCAAVGGDPVQRLRELDRLVAKHPITGVAPNADGVMRKITVDPKMLIDIYSSGGYIFDPYRELDAAVRAVLQPQPDDLPLLRLAREEQLHGGGGNITEYSQGLADASECTDYPQLYDMSAPPKLRSTQYADAITSLEQTDPNAFAPFTIHEWITSNDEDYDTCLRWPVPRYPHPLLPPGATYPDVPTLVLVGDLDSVTSAEGAKQVAQSFPDSTFVEVSNMVHVSALGDITGCAAGIVLRFVQTLSAGDTSCAAQYPEVRAVDAFYRTATDVPGSAQTKAALVAVDTVADVMARYEVMYGSRGVGLRGGTFVERGAGHRSWTFDDVRWVADVGVSGTATYDAGSGAAHAIVTLTGPGLPHWQIDLRWNVLEPLAQVTVHGVLGAQTFDLTVPAA